MHLALIELRLAAARFFLRFPHARVSTKENFVEEEDMRQITFFMGTNLLVNLLGWILM